MSWAALVGANALMLVTGIGLLPLLGLVRSRRQLLQRLPLAYAAGLAATGILAAELAIVDVPVGWPVLGVAAAGSVVFGLRRLGPGISPPRNRLTFASGLALLGLGGAYLYQLGRVFTVKPLDASDGWAIWGTRAWALYAFGHPAAPVFTTAPYQALQHPLLLPALEAVDARVIGSFSPTLVQAQEFGFALALVAGAWGLLRSQVPGPLLAGILLASITTVTFYNQIASNFADIPLAVFVALGLASLAIEELPAAALFLGAAALTKNEGEVFALTAFVAALVVARRGRRRAIGLAALAVLLLDLPWRIWIWVHHVKIAEYSISNLFDPTYLYDHRDRVWPTVRELWAQLSSIGAFDYLGVLVLAGLAGGIVLRRYRLVFLGVLWFALSFAGLLGIYWISTNTVSSHLFNSSDRTIVSLVYASALYVAVLLQRESEP